MTDDLIKRLRRYAGDVCLSTDDEMEAAATIEAQAKRIAELEASAEKAEAALAAARAALVAVLDWTGSDDRDYPEHATVIAAARGEKSTRRIPGAQRTMADDLQGLLDGAAAIRAALDGEPTDDSALWVVEHPDVLGGQSDDAFLREMAAMADDECPTCNGMGFDLPAAILTALDDAGLVVVPRKATIPMMQAAEKAVEARFPYASDSLKADRSIVCWDAHAAMIAASPFAKKEVG
jgi:hypothetical protein